MKRLAKSLLAGVIVQILIFLSVVAAGQLLPKNPAGSLQSLSELIFIAFIFLSPGLMLFAPAATVRNPHPPFSDVGLMLGIIVDILVYSAVAYVAASVWRSVKARGMQST